MTGGRFVYLSPGGRVQLGSAGSAYVYVQLPVFRAQKPLASAARPAEPVR